MKKRILPIFIALLLLVLPVSALANEPVGIVKVGYSTPTVDGNIGGAAEGWNCGFELNNTLYGTAWSAHEDYRWVCRYYTAYDKDGIYFAADMDDNFDLVFDAAGSTIHNGFIYSTEDTSASDDNGFAFDGDVFILALDPQNYFMREGYEKQSHFTAWYNVGLFADGDARIYRTWSPRADNYGETGPVSGAKVNGHSTANGWCFEAFIPWSEIAKDCSAASGGEWNPTAADLSKPSEGDIYTDGYIDRANGNTWTSGDIMYIDRYENPDDGGLDTWQRYLTTAANVRGGFGTLSDGISLACYGIYFKLLAEGSTEVPGRYGGGGNMDDGTNKGSIDDNPVSNITGDTSSGGGSAAGSGSSGGGRSGGSTAGDGSAQTFDPGIIAASLAVCVSGGAIYAIKRKRK